jgi:hypothetical protein
LWSNTLTPYVVAVTGGRNYEGPDAQGHIFDVLRAVNERRRAEALTANDARELSDLKALVRRSIDATSNLPMDKSHMNYLLALEKAIES